MTARDVPPALDALCAQARAIDREQRLSARPSAARGASCTSKRGSCSSSCGADQSPESSMPAPTVAFVDSSTRMNEPVVRFCLYAS